MDRQFTYTESGTPNERITIRPLIGATGWVFKETRRIDFSRESASYPAGDFLGRRTINPVDMPTAAREWAESLPGVGSFCYTCQKYAVDRDKCPHCGAARIGSAVAFTPAFNQHGEHVGYRQSGFPSDFWADFHKSIIPDWGLVFWPFRTGGNGHPAEIRALPPFLGNIADELGWSAEFPYKGDWELIVTPELADQEFAGRVIRDPLVGRWIIQGFAPFKKRLRQVRDRLNKMSPGDGGRESLEKISDLLA